MQRVAQFVRLPEQASKVVVSHCEHAIVALGE
jgi:hypothetical protein